MTEEITINFPSIAPLVNHFYLKEAALYNKSFNYRETYVPLFGKSHSQGKRERERMRESEKGAQRHWDSFTEKCNLKAVKLGGWAHLNCVFIIKTVSGLISPTDSI